MSHSRSSNNSIFHYFPCQLLFSDLWPITWQVAICGRAYSGSQFTLIVHSEDKGTGPAAVVVGTWTARSQFGGTGNRERGRCIYLTFWLFPPNFYSSHSPRPWKDNTRIHGGSSFLKHTYEHKRYTSLISYISLVRQVVKINQHTW